jgi:hypothetical protein
MTGSGKVRGLAVFDRLARSRSEEVEQGRVYAHLSLVKLSGEKISVCLIDAEEENSLSVIRAG